VFIRVPSASKASPLASTAFPSTTILQKKPFYIHFDNIETMKLTFATAICALTFSTVSAFAPSTQVGSSFVGSVQVQSRDAGEWLSCFLYHASYSHTNLLKKGIIGFFISQLGMNDEC
jgi:hypothetical protein